MGVQDHRMNFGKRSTAEEVTAGLDLSGKVYIVTGGSSGLGEETARVLVLRNATVVVAARNMSAAEMSKKRIMSSLVAKDGVFIEPRVMELDLSSLQSVRKFAKRFLDLNWPLHALINNAGCMASPYSLTEDGREAQFGTNHLGHFLLTNLLLNKLKSTAEEQQTETRVVNLSSSLHRKPYSEGIRFDRLDSKEGYHPFHAYGQSKLANILHANELSRRLKAEGVTNVTVNSLHPGVIRTNLVRHVLAPTYKRISFDLAYGLLLKWHWKSIPQGAATTCLVAVHPLLIGVTGKYFEDCKEAMPSKFAQDAAMAKKLWDVSEKLVAL